MTRHIVHQYRRAWFSHLSFHRSMVGRHLPVLQTATGMAYLAFCGEAEREQILALLATRDEPDYHLARDRLALDNILRKARHRGYGENYMGWPTSPPLRRPCTTTASDYWAVSA